MDIWRFTVALDLVIFINFLADLSYNFKLEHIPPSPFPNCDQLKQKPIKSNFIRNENEDDTRLDPWKTSITLVAFQIKKTTRYRMHDSLIMYCVKFGFKLV